MTEDKLNELEVYIEQNIRDDIDSIDVYKSKKPFTFLPGHRALIFGIKDELLKQSEDKKPKFGNRQPNRQQIFRDNWNENDLQVSLKHQISSYEKDCLGSHGLETHYIVNEVNLIQTENQTFARCTVLCPICGTVNSLRYEKYWKVSNVFKHFRHINTISVSSNDRNGLHVKLSARSSHNRHISTTPDDVLLSSNVSVGIV